MTCAPTMRFADHLDMASETSEPAKPITADITSSALKLMPPDSFSQRSTPSNRRVMLITNTTAKLVKINRKIRFINLSPPMLKSCRAVYHSGHFALRTLGVHRQISRAVSYTHLTLPTIYSV